MGSETANQTVENDLHMEVLTRITVIQISAGYTGNPEIFPAAPGG